MAKVQRERFNIFQGQHLGKRLHKKYGHLRSNLAIFQKSVHFVRWKSEFPVLNQLDLNGMDPNQLRMVI